MRYTFGEFELDVPGREVRRAGEPVALQPQVFALLRHLVENRGRVVGKDELLEVISPGAQVTDGSLQRVVSLLHSSLRPELVRTYPKQGYRFVAQVGDVDRGGSERPRWARSGDMHVAWRAQGERRFRGAASCYASLPPGHSVVTTRWSPRPAAKAS